MCCWYPGELDATKANAASLVAQLQLETADKQQLSTKLADSETIKNELEAKVDVKSNNSSCLTSQCICCSNSLFVRRLQSSIAEYSS